MIHVFLYTEKKYPLTSTNQYIQWHVFHKQYYVIKAASNKWFRNVKYILNAFDFMWKELS